MTNTNTTTVTETQRGFIPLPQAAARALITTGAIGTIASAFLSWTWTSEFPGDLTLYGNPAGLQILALVAGALTLLHALHLWNVPGLSWLNPARATSPVLLTAPSAFAVCWFTAIAIAVKLGGLVNLDPGAYIAAIASGLPVIGALALPHPAPGTGIRGYLTKPDQPRTGDLSALAERAIITAGT
ncbi:MAG: branched-chain amino acid ABC transporter permease, partial [Actinomycetia bacterium]|nr:branched-chain amino acid ABC transporter permease [Actinomycetes bacterium]